MLPPRGKPLKDRLEFFLEEQATRRWPRARAEGRSEGLRVFFRRQGRAVASYPSHAAPAPCPACRRPRHSLPPKATRGGSYLQGNAPYANRSEHPLPALLVLDIKMPLLDGLDTLAWVRSSQFAALPAVILSTSGHPADMEKATRLGASDYHVKPPGVSELSKLLMELHRRWISGKAAPGPDRLKG